MEQSSRALQRPRPTQRVRSNGNLLVAQDSVSIVEFEPSTGNSIIISL